jgi:hypothetical protein
LLRTLLKFGEYHSLTRIHVQYAEFATKLCHK